MTIAVFGSTGQLGSLVIDALLARGVPSGDLRALGRDEERLAQLAQKGLATATVELGDPVSLAPALEGVDAVLLISGSEVGKRVAQHANAITAAAQAGVSRIVYTSAPRATTSALVLAPEHKATEEAIAASGIASTILRNNWYTENYRPEFERARETGAIASSLAGGRIASATRDDLAEAAAVVLTTDGHDGRVYELGGDVAWTFEDFATTASEVLGRPVAYTALTPEQEAAALKEAGADDGTIAFVTALNASIRDGALAETTGELARLIGRPTATLEDTLRSWV